MTSRQIGLIGAGNVGAALAKRLVEIGHSVKVANSKGPKSLEQFEKETGAKAVHLESITDHSEILIVAIPLGNTRYLKRSLSAGSLENVIVVDTGNYFPQRDGSIAEIDHGTPESAWVSQQLGVPVVKAFNNIIAAGLAKNGKTKGARRRIALPVASDDPRARATIMALVEELGFSAFDAGPIDDSWRQQPGQPAYCTDPTLGELPVLLKRADRKTAARNREQAMEILAKIPPNFPAQDLVYASRFSIGLDALRPRSWFAMLHLGIAIMRSRKHPVSPL
jgi:hypothetical protein